MNTQVALFQAILDDPEDDAARLVYADWIEEHGQAEAERAQFIRVQCELARPGLDEARRAELERHKRRLLTGRKKAWLAELPKLRGVMWGDFVRGFVGSARLQSVFMFHRHAKRIFESAPIQVLWFKQVAALKGIGNSKYLSHVTEIHLLGTYLLKVESLADLIQSPRLGRLRHLSMPGTALGDEGARILAQHMKNFPRLAVLDLGQCGIRDAGANFLAESPHLVGLEKLLLGGNRFTAAGRAALVERFSDRVKMGERGGS
jgi:uncharacterized protein (TIGR02996 family)